MSYHGIGAGPGPTTTYRVDAPFPWGKDTELVIPVQQITDDAWAALQPHVNDLINDVEGEAARVAPDLARKVINEVVMPDLAKEMEVAFAKADIIKKQVILALAGVAAVVVASAWWIKKG